MIKYDPFFATLKDKNLTWYQFRKQHDLSESILTSLKNNKPMRTSTLEKLCELLDCGLEDIATFDKSETRLEYEQKNPLAKKKANTTKKKSSNK